MDICHSTPSFGTNNIDQCHRVPPALLHNYMLSLLLFGHTLCPIVSVCLFTHHSVHLTPTVGADGLISVIAGTLDKTLNISLCCAGGRGLCGHREHETIGQQASSPHVVRHTFESPNGPLQLERHFNNNNCNNKPLISDTQGLTH